ALRHEVIRRILPGDIAILIAGLDQQLAGVAARRNALAVDAGRAGNALDALRSGRTGIALRALRAFGPRRTGDALGSRRPGGAARREQGPERRRIGRCRAGDRITGDADICRAFLLHGIVALIGGGRIPGAAPVQAARSGFAGQALRPLDAGRALQTLRPLGTHGSRLAAAEIDARRPVGGAAAQLEEKLAGIGGEEGEAGRRVVMGGARRQQADRIRGEGLSRRALHALDAGRPLQTLGSLRAQRTGGTALAFRTRRTAAALRALPTDRSLRTGDTGFALRTARTDRAAGQIALADQRRVAIGIEGQHAVGARAGVEHQIRAGGHVALRRQLEAARCLLVDLL